MRKAAFILSLIISTISLSSYTTREGKPVIRNVGAMEYGGHNRNFDILCEASGKVFVANFEGLMIWDGLAWKMIHTPGISRVTKLFPSKDGIIWVGGFNLFGYIGENDEITYVAADTSSVSRFGEVNRIGEDAGGVYFSASEGKFRIVDGKLKVVDALPPVAEMQGIPGKSDVQAESVVGFNNIAVGTAADGVVMTDSDGRILDVIDTDDGLCSNSIAALAYDGKGTLWGATDNGLFYLNISPVFSYFGATDGLFGQVTSICYSEGTLYVGTLQGLFTLGKESEKFEKVPDLDLACWQLVKTEKGVIYAATAQGLYVVGGNMKKLSERHTISITLPKDGTVITGEVNGMYRISTDGKEEILNDIPNVLKFKTDNDGGIWAINYLQNRYYASPDGKYSFVPKDNPDLNILFGYEGPDGSSWHSKTGNAGLFCEGLPDNEAAWLNTLDAYSVDAMEISGETAFIGGNFGMIKVDLKNARTVNPYRTGLYFRTFVQDGSSVFYTASIDRTEPFGAVKYSYRLRENDEWSEWSDDNNDMAFSHLSPDNYALTVRCLDEFGQISMTAPEYFSVKPPFYLKWFAFCIYFIILAIAVKISFDIYFNREKKKKEILEKTVEERTVQLKEVQNKLLIQEREATIGKLTRGLIDRILNPMNYINNFAHLSIGLAGDLADNIEDEKGRMTQDNYEDCTDVIGMLKEDLDKIEQHGLSTTRILKAMEELLKERSGKVEQEDMVQVCAQNAEMFRRYYEKEIRELNLDFQWIPPSESVTANINADTVSKTVMSVLANSMYAVAKKFRGDSSARPEIRMLLEKKNDGGCILTVHDNGVGIEEAILDKIFDPFFTTKLTSEASGIGLYLCRQFIQDMGGRIDVASEKDQYTRVTIELL